MTLQTLQNLQTFLRRVQVVGEESMAWCQAWSELTEAIAKEKQPSAPKQPESTA